LAFISKAAVPATKIRTIAGNAIARNQRQIAANFAEISNFPAHAISIPTGHDPKKYGKKASNKPTTAASGVR
jgi:hypothetical protein